jgi:hypothetical protein
MSNSYFVAPGKAISDNRSGGISKVYLGGEEFPADTLTPEQRKEKIDTGFLIRRGQTDVPEAASTKTLPPVNTKGEFGKAVMWDSNPQTLVDQPLENLNNMVKAKDATVPTFEDKNEAIIFLSQDFGKATE